MKKISITKLQNETPLPELNGMGLTYSLESADHLENVFLTHYGSILSDSDVITLLKNYLELSKYPHLFIYSRNHELIKNIEELGINFILFSKEHTECVVNEPLLILDSVIEFEAQYPYLRTFENNILTAFQLQVLFFCPSKGSSFLSIYKELNHYLNTSYQQVHFYVEGEYAKNLAQILSFITPDFPKYIFNYESPQLHHPDQRWVSWDALAGDRPWKTSTIWHPSPNQALVILHEPKLWRKAYRWCTKISNIPLSQIELIFPYLEKKKYSFADDPTPSAVWAFPYAGAGRLWPTINGMASLLERPQVWLNDEHYRGLKENSYESLIKNRQNRLEKTIDLLDNYQCLMFHHGYYKLDNISTKFIKLLVLTRDPRDIYLSRSFRALGVFDEEFIEDLMLNGDMHVLPNLYDMLRQFEIVNKSHNMYAISFEDINENPYETYTKAMDWLGWLPSQFNSDLEIKSELNKLIAQALPSNQKKEHHHRGSIRSGKSGNWKEYWTPKLTTIFNTISTT